MSRSKRKLSIVTAFAAGTFLVSVAGSSSAAHRTSADEVSRLSSHFATVLQELRAANVTHLSDAQRSARLTLFSRLEEYAAAKRFPHNHVVAGRRVPVFRDEHQTLCAMGYLIATTGRIDIVEAVVRNANLARIPELARDQRLIMWLDSAGLSMAEAARIQPAYDGGRCVGCIIPSPQPTNEVRPPVAYYGGSAAASALSGVAVALNVWSTDANVMRRSAKLGLVAGTAQMILGAFVLDQRATVRNVGVANMAMGAASVGTAIWRVRNLPAKRDLAARTVSVHPIFTPSRFGLTVTAGI